MESLLILISIASFALLCYILILIKSNRANLDQIKIQENLDDVLNQNFNEIYTHLQKLILESFSKQNTSLERAISDLQIKLIENLSNSGQQNLLSLTQGLTDTQKTIVNTTRQSLQELGEITKERLNEMRYEVQRRLDENFAKSLGSFQKINENLGQMEERAKAMISATKSIDKLNDVFARTSSKSFGTFSEDYLEMLLSESLVNNSWEKQVRIQGASEIIDFVISIGDRKIGIDSKFPFTKYKDFLDCEEMHKEIKKKEYYKTILDLSKSLNQKYYQLNLLDHVILYLPSESMYHLCLENSDLMKQIGGYKISLSSPNNLYPLLQILSSYQFKIKIAKNAESIIAGLKNVQDNIRNFKLEYTKLGEKLRLAQNNYKMAEDSLNGVDSNIQFMLESNESKTEIQQDLIL
jgi:DNA anti-recombination protein RmuC